MFHSNLYIDENDPDEVKFYENFLDNSAWDGIEYGCFGGRILTDEELPIGCL